MVICQMKVNFALAEFPGTAPKFKTSQIYCLFDVFLHIAVTTVMDKAP